MAAEAGVLGIPFVRFNDFVGRISYLDELENKYRLGFGIKPENKDRLYKVVQEIINDPDLEKSYAEKRKEMLSAKIDFAKFLQWFIPNFPESRQKLKANPDYQYSFK
jgi:hypothetical protein